MSEQGAFGFYDGPPDPDPVRKAKLERAVRAIVIGFDLRVDNYHNEIAIIDGGRGPLRVLVAHRVVIDVVSAARYMGKLEPVAAAFDRVATERHRAALGDYQAPDWRPSEAMPEDFYAF
jgi:hypothetical protein